MSATGAGTLPRSAGVTDVLPAIDMDMMAGGMFKHNEQLHNDLDRKLLGWVGSHLEIRARRMLCSARP